MELKGAEEDNVIGQFITMEKEKFEKASTQRRLKYHVIGTLLNLFAGLTAAVSGLSLQLTKVSCLWGKIR